MCGFDKQTGDPKRPCPAVHRRQQAAEQYRKYVNRYGAGMVVYWFGLLDELAEADEDVILVAELPPEREILRLPLLRVTPLSGTAAALIDTAKT